MNKELSLVDLLGFIKKNIIVTLITAIAFSVITFAVSTTISTTEYTYSCSFTVDTYWNGDQDLLTPNGAYSAANYAVYSINTYKELLKGSKLLNEVIKDAGYENLISSDAARSFLVLENKPDTMIITAHFTSTNDELTQRLANSYAKIAPLRSKLSYSSLNVSEDAVRTNVQSTPVKLYTAVAFFLGATIVLVLLFFIESLDTRIKSASDVENKYKIANLGIIPNFYTGGGKNYKAYKKGAYVKNEAYTNY